MLLADVKNCLLSVTQKTWRYGAPAGTTFPYIIYYDDSQSDALYGDGRMLNQTIQGTIHLFAAIADDPLKSQIQTALNNAGICFWLNMTMPEKDPVSGKIICIHHEWVWEIPTEV